jgi:hypothetical protein
LLWSSLTLLPSHVTLPPIGAVGQLVAAGLSNLGQLYLTSEGAAKTHINNAITAKARVLEAMLGE